MRTINFLSICITLILLCGCVASQESACSQAVIQPEPEAWRTCDIVLPCGHTVGAHLIDCTVRITAKCCAENERWWKELGDDIMGTRHTDEQDNAMERENRRQEARISDFFNTPPPRIFGLMDLALNLSPIPDWKD